MYPKTHSNGFKKKKTVASDYFIGIMMAEYVTVATNLRSYSGLGFLIILIHTLSSVCRSYSTGSDAESVFLRTY